VRLRVLITGWMKISDQAVLLLKEMKVKKEIKIQVWVK